MSENWGCACRVCPGGASCLRGGAKELGGLCDFCANGHRAGDAVDHPSHYNAGRFEVIDVIEDWKLGFHAGNAVKYIARADHKGRRLEDLRKARWYLDRLISRGGTEPELARLCTFTYAEAVALLCESIEVPRDPTTVEGGQQILAVQSLLLALVDALDRKVKP